MFDIQEELKKLPEKSGVYLMKDENDKIIYVGKAVNLRSRVRQYFQPSSAKFAKVRSMTADIVEFEYIVTDNEVEALILECNLIKKHWPKYNVVLKDDKAYPYIKLTVNERFPRIFKAHHMDKDKAKYFGPFTSHTAVKDTLTLIREIWPLRSCAKKFPRDIGKERPCLNYHIGQCKAPCTGKFAEEEYRKLVDEIIRFLNGKHDDVIARLEREMAACAENLEFEQAAALRDKISAVKLLSEKQKIDKGQSGDQDVIAFAGAGGEALVQVFFIRAGKMTGREHFMLNGVGELSGGEVLAEFIKQFYGETTYIPKELILETEIEEKSVISEWLTLLKGQNVILTVPQKGEKHSLVQLASKNAVLSFEQFGEKMRREQEKTIGALTEISETLQLESIPERIEAYDISNIQGFESVGSMVVFENGKAKNSDYRKFKIKGVFGPNDYASMEEVIDRRLTRYKKELEEGEEFGKFSKLPDIIFMDGGKAQVHAAENVLNRLNISIPVCGMVKDDRHRTRGLLYCDKEILFSPHSEAFKLITRIQDEVHRFAVEYHRKLRADKQVKSVLDDIDGIGPVRRKSLMRHFGSIEGIMDAGVEELAEVDTMNKASAEAVYNFFRR